MRIRLPAMDGQEIDCPHQYVGRCEACDALASGQTAVATSSSLADGLGMSVPVMPADFGSSTTFPDFE